MAPHTDRSILLVLSAEQSSRLRSLVDSTDMATNCRHRARRRALVGALLLALVALGWQGREAASSLIQWAVNVPTLN